jgi:hypothetical protein
VASAEGHVDPSGDELLLQHRRVSVSAELADELHRSRSRDETRGGDGLVRAFSSHGDAHSRVYRRDRLLQRWRAIDPHCHIYVDGAHDHDVRGRGVARCLSRGERYIRRREKKQDCDRGVHGAGERPRCRHASRTRRMNEWVSRVHGAGERPRCRHASRTRRMNEWVSRVSTVEASL